MEYFKKLLCSLTVVSISLVAHANLQCLPTQLQKFKTTGICRGCDLSEVNLMYSHYENVDLSEALLVKANLSSSNFYTSNFNKAQLMYADLCSIQASGSSFVSANLTQANLSNANLSSSDFTGAILTGVNLASANLARAIISSEQLAQVASLSCTIMPNGIKHLSDSGEKC